MRILVVEDDKTIVAHLNAALRQEGFAVDSCTDGAEGFKRASEVPYDAAIIDLMLPKLDGLSLIEELRRRGTKTPVLILSAKQSVDERIAGLRAGGDDYLVKPFALAELVARIQALIRRATNVGEPMQLSYADITLDLRTRIVTRGGKKIELRPREFSLLEYMLRNPESVLSKSMILEHVWDYHFDPQTNVVDVLVCRLRNKIEENTSTRLIHTVRGAGYVLRKAQDD